MENNEIKKKTNWWLIIVMINFIVMAGVLVFFATQSNNLIEELEQSTYNVAQASASVYYKECSDMLENSKYNQTKTKVCTDKTADFVKKLGEELKDQ